MLPLEYYERFRAAISELPRLPQGTKYRKAELICERFRLFSERGLNVYYAPFHHTTRDARVALVGLTPGFTQMEDAFRAAKNYEGKGLSDAEIFAHVDATGSFSGPMRGNLVQMLDDIGLNARFGLATCGELFERQSRSLVHFTSAVSAPIFKAGENYNGSPPLLGVPSLRKWVLENLSEELASMPEALIIPLGKTADAAVDLISSQGFVDGKRCLIGFPHPSGANGHRKTLFERSRNRWREQLKSL